MDLRMPGMDGVVATRLITARQPGVRVLILTRYDTDIVPAVEVGAVGYLLKGAAREEVTEAIRAAVRGERVLAPPVAAKLVRHVRAPGAAAGLFLRHSRWPWLGLHEVGIHHRTCRVIVLELVIYQAVRLVVHFLGMLAGKERAGSDQIGCPVRSESIEKPHDVVGVLRLISAHYGVCFQA
jgi:Response regulator receiver domain